MVLPIIKHQLTKIRSENRVRLVKVSSLFSVIACVTDLTGKKFKSISTYTDSISCILFIRQLFAQISNYKKLNINSLLQVQLESNL